MSDDVRIPDDPGTLRVQVGPVSMRYADGGSRDPRAPVVLCIHGITRSLADFTPLAHELGDGPGCPYRVLRLDLPGYGRSTPLPDGETHGLAQLTTYVGRFLDALGVTAPVHLVGNSLGGAVALRFAVDNPERVADVALLAPGGFGAEVALALRIVGLPLLGPSLVRPSRGGSARGEAQLYHDPSLATPERIAHTYALSHRPWARRVTLETSRELGTLAGIRPEWRAELLERAGALDVPVLVAWGDDDRILPGHHLDAAAAALPNATTHRFERCGHCPQIEKPAETARVLRDFWSSHADR